MIDLSSMPCHVVEDLQCFLPCDCCNGSTEDIASTTTMPLVKNREKGTKNERERHETNQPWSFSYEATSTSRSQFFLKIKITTS